jgi:CCR4-NOT transcription complex subunit 9
MGGSATATASNPGQSATTGSGPSADNALASVANMDGAISEENRKVFVWVAELLDPNRRETALMELSKKREQVPELALVIWHSFGRSSQPTNEIWFVVPR